MSINLLRVVEENIGGTYTHLALLDRYLIESGRIGLIHTVSVLGQSSGTNLDERIVHHSINERKIDHNLRRSLGISSQVKAFVTIDSLLEEIGFDLMHIHSPHTFIANLATIAALRNGIPIVITYHGGQGSRFYPISVMKINAFLPKLIARKKLAISIETKRLLGYDAEIVGVPVDSSMFNWDGRNYFAQITSRPDEKIIFYPARINPVKGQLDLVYAIRQLSSSLNEPFKVVMAGEVNDSDYDRKLREEIKNLGLDERIVILEQIPFSQMGRAYHGAYVLAFPTKSEGLGKIIIEGGLCGVPTIAYAVGGVPELIIHGRNGYLVPKSDITGMADCLASLLVNQSQRGLLGRTAREDYSSKFDARVVAQKNLNAYLEILQKH